MNRTTQLFLGLAAGILAAGRVSLGQQAAPALAPAPEAASAPAPAAVHPARPEDLIGKPPPPIKVARWFKGEPVTEFKKGTVYVVDFWATWCGPCKAAIPHLTRLAKENKGRVEVIGISISERQNDPTDAAYLDAVEKFVKKMDDRMEYPVAADTPDKAMHSTWFKPTGTGGIPTAYIIDQRGLVAWVGIGAPADIERIVGEVLAGTFDYSKEKALQQAAELEAKKRSEADIAAAKKNQSGTNQKYPGYQEAMDRGDTGAALASLNAAFEANRDSESSGAYQWKLMLLLQRNKPEEIHAYARELLDRYPTNDDIVSFLSACIVSTSDEPRFDSKLALEAAQKAASFAKPDSRWEQFAKWRLGWALFHVGEKKKAVDSVQTALENVRRLKGTIDFGDLEAECEDAMKTFAKAAG